MKKFFLIGVTLFTSVFLPASLSFAQEAGRVPIPFVDFNIRQAQSTGEVASALQILLLITVLSLAPTILLLLTSYIRIYIVMSFVSRGLATQTIPPNQIIIGLSLFVSLFLMYPVFDKAYQGGIQPYMDGKITIEKGYEKALEPFREFMFRQTEERYIYRFVKLAKIERPRNRDDVPTHILIPAFILNELTISFYMGILILIPFTVIDVVVASTLMSMGMMMLPPIMISFPLKIALFVMVDGWNLLVENLVKSFGM